MHALLPEEEESLPGLHQPMVIWKGTRSSHLRPGAVQEQESPISPKHRATVQSINEANI